MYHFFLKRKLRAVMGKLNQGDYPAVVAMFAPDAEHWFAGQHALSGRRTSPARIAEWYRRLPEVFPGIRFEVRSMTVAGGPWDTAVAIEWRDELHDRLGNPMPNEGVFVIRLRWGKVRRFHVYCDTAKIERNLGIIARQGVPAAAAAPIEGS